MPSIQTIAPPRSIQDLRQAIATMLYDHFGETATVDRADSIIQVSFPCEGERRSACIAIVDRDHHTGCAHELGERFGDDSPPVLCSVDLVELPDPTPDAFVLTDNERRIVEMIRHRELSYDDVSDYIDLAYRDKPHLDNPVDHEDFVALRAFRHFFGELLESAMDHHGGPITYIQVEHQVRDLWRFEVSADIDGKVCGAELTLRESEH